MRKAQSTARLLWMAAAVLAYSLARLAAAEAAYFEFSTMIRAGASGTGANQWEFGVGPSYGSPSATGNVTPYYADGGAYLFEVGYLNASNSAYVRVYADTNPASSYQQTSFQPTGGAQTAANAVWTLPAHSFFVTAGPSLVTSIQVSNLSLSGIDGAVTVLDPIQQTTLAVSSILILTGTVRQSGDVTFLADANGDWRLRGTIQMWGLSAYLLGTASGYDLSFGLQAYAADSPEPSTLALALAGVLLIVIGRRRGPVGGRA